MESAREDTADLLGNDLRWGQYSVLRYLGPLAAGLFFGSLYWTRPSSQPVMVHRTSTIPPQQRVTVNSRLLRTFCADGVVGELLQWTSLGPEEVCAGIYDGQWTI